MFEDFLNYIKNEKRYSEHTIRAYENDLYQYLDFGQSTSKDFNPLMGDHQIIRKWIVFLMQNGDKARSVNRKISTLKSYYKFLFKQGVIQNLPMEKIVKPKMEKNLPYFVEKNSINQLLDCFPFPDTFEGLRDRTIILAFYCTGMRLSELSHLKINDIDFNSSQLKVLGKRNKERIIPFGIELRVAFKKYIEERNKISQPHNILFITSKGVPVYDKLVYRVVNKYLGEVTTMKKRSPHVLRHTFATHLLNNGAELDAIKELLGHSNLMATQIYTHTTFERLIEIYNQAHPRA